MLSDQDMDQLLELLGATAEVVGDELRPAAAALMAEDLATYPLPVLAKALAACRRELKGRLPLAAILERIDDGHPAPNEAWAMAVPAADERNTVVWTEEVQQAWGVALPLIGSGDKIGARMAFLEAYGRLLKQARADRRPARYVPSLGDDAGSRESTLRDAASRGLLAPAALAPHLYLTGPEPPPNVQHHLRALAEVLSADSPEHRAQAVTHGQLTAQAERDALEATRQQELARMQAWVDARTRTDQPEEG